MDKIRLRFFGPYGQPSGYGQACNDYLKCLRLIPEIDLDIRPIFEIDTDDIDARYHDLIPYVNCQDDQDWPTHTVVHTIPYYGTYLLQQAAAKQLLPSKSHRIAITTWETSVLPQPCIESLQNFNETWWPSAWNVEMASLHLQHQKRAPHAFDPVWWSRKIDIPRTDTRFTFYTILTWCERKNPIGLLKAYLTAFTAKDNVVLKILTPSYSKGDIDGLKLALNIPAENLPALEFLGNPRLSQDQLLALHRNSDCYVSTARAEGFGLGMFEALIVGNTVIAPDYGGQLDFLCTSNGATLYPYQLTPAIVPFTPSENVIEVGGLTIRPVQHNTHIGIAGDQHWAEPDLHTLQNLMRGVTRTTFDPAWKQAIRTEHEARYGYEAVAQILRRNLGL